MDLKTLKLKSYRPNQSIYSLSDAKNKSDVVKYSEYRMDRTSNYLLTRKALRGTIELLCIELSSR